MSSLWVDKYKPKIIDDIVGNKDKIKQIKAWLDVFITGNFTENFKNGILISGCPGIGKTSSATVILNEMGFDVLDFDISTERTNKNMQTRLNLLNGGGNILTLFQTNKVKALVLDEIDGVHNSERGSITELISFLECDKLYGSKSKNKNKRHINTNPIICICNNMTNSLKKLNKACIHIPFSKPNNDDIFKLLRKIALNENIKINDICLRLLVQHAQKDIRRAIYLLETIKINMGIDYITCNDIENFKIFFGNKNIETGLYQAVNNIYNLKDLSIDNCLENFDVDKVFVPLLVHENILDRIDSDKSIDYNTKKYKVIYFYNNLIDSCVIDTLMFNKHIWELKDYVALLSCTTANKIIDGGGVSQKLRCSPVISKTNYKYYNLKLINEICRKLHIPVLNFQEYTKLFYDIVIYMKYTNEKRSEFISDLKTKLTFTNFEKIIKLSYLYNDYNKKYTIKVKNKLCHLFNSL